MEFRDGLASELPAPRDDEPASLRDDILDELADHLSCAYRRELLRGADAALARVRVLEKFGDPAAIARRLWFDAMRGRIMTQRLLVGTCVLLAVVCLLFAGLVWRQSMEAQRQLAQARASAESAQREMAKQLERLSRAVASPKSTDWIPVQFLLHQGREDGPPGVGFKATLGKGNGGAKKDDAIQRESDANGLLDFGVVQPGDWEFTISHSSDNAYWSTAGKLNALPGESIERIIVCPDLTREPGKVKVRVAWPEKLKDKGFGVIAEFKHEGFTPVGELPLKWSLVRKYGSSGRPNYSVLIGPGSADSVGTPCDRCFFWMLARDQFIGSSRQHAIEVEKLAGKLKIDLPSYDPRKEFSAIPGRYRLQSLVIVRPNTKAPPAPGTGRFDVVAYVANKSNYYGRESVLFPSNDTDQPQSFVFGGVPLDGTPVAKSFWDDDTRTRVEARTGEAAEWTISLPQELVDAVK